MQTQGAGHQSGRPHTAGSPVLPVITAVLSACLIVAAAASVAVAAPVASPSALPGTAATPTPPHALPGGAGTSSFESAGRPGCGNCAHWIVAGRPGVTTARIAAAHGAVPMGAGSGIYRIGRESAVRLARALGRAGRLAFTEPDVPVQPAGYPAALFAANQTWLSQIVDPAETSPPEVTGSSPLVAVVENGINPGHPALTGARITSAVPSGNLVDDSHGTAVASIIGSPGGESLVRGVLPGARMEYFRRGDTCFTTAAAVVDAVRAGASVINMSYVIAPSGCYSHYLAIQRAVKANALPVAAAGNYGLPEMGNPPLPPAIYPHVISVAAVDQANLRAAFSTYNGSVDLSAPGTGLFGPEILPGGSATGGGTGSQQPRFTWTAENKGLNGTSFAAPMVSAAAAWIRQVRPGYSAYQAGRVLLDSSTDLGSPGRDPEYGNGLLDIDAALVASRPPNDAREPNDDIPILKGTAGIPRAKYLWKPGGKRVVKLRATLSRAKDPADVYRVRIPARKRILITAAQLDGDVAITALKPSTRTLAKTRGKVIVKSDRLSPKTEGIKVRNLRRRPADIWLAVTPGSRASTDYAAYRLTIRRSH